MSEPQRDGAQWLTVSEAAALLRVSERTVRRRCERGKIAARLESTVSGPTWIIDGAELQAPAAKIADATAIAADTCGQAADAITSAKAPETDAVPPLAAVNLRTPADTPKPDANQRETDLIAALIAEKDGRIADLQKQLDASNGALEREQMAHSETRRALAFVMATPPVLAPVAQTKPDAVPMPTRPPQRPQKRKPRPFWAALIGYRLKD